MEQLVSLSDALQQATERVQSAQGRFDQAEPGDWLAVDAAIFDLTAAEAWQNAILAAARRDTDGC